jgi:hypothetical protein
MNYRVLGKQSFMCSPAGDFLKRPQCARGWRAALLVLILVVTWNWSAAYGDVLNVDLSSATVAGAVPINSQFLPDVVWINFYVDGQYATSTSGSAGSFTWPSTWVNDGVHDITVFGYDGNSMVSGYSDIRLTSANWSPSANAGTVTISGYADQWIAWVNLYVDTYYSQFATGTSWSVSQSFAPGTHQVQVNGYYGNALMAAAQVGGLNFSDGQQPIAVTSRATIPALTGSASGIPGADTNPADYGQYNAPGGSGDGMGLIGGPLLTDAQAASFVVPTKKSTPELSLPCTWCGNKYTPNGPANAAADNYYNNIASTNPSNYLYQLQAPDGFWATAASWGGVSARIDGACPMANPTTAEVLQWAANKWGVNPLLMYAEASEEGGWDQLALGDDGCTSGVCQVADRNSSLHPYHAFPGFAGAGSMLSRENTCFNADFFAAHLYAAFRGWTGECPGGDIGTAIETWWSAATSAGIYTSKVYEQINDQLWVPLYFQSQPVPY